MVTVIRNGLEEFKASYNPSKCQLYFISSEGITNSSVLVESISENCSEIFPALVMYPRVPLFSVSSLKEGGTGTRNHQLPEMSSCRGRETLAWCVLIPWLCMHSPLCQCLLGHNPLLPHWDPFRSTPGALVLTEGSYDGKRVCTVICAVLLAGVSGDDVEGKSGPY